MAGLITLASVSGYWIGLAPTFNLNFAGINAVGYQMVLDCVSTSEGEPLVISYRANAIGVADDTNRLKVEYFHPGLKFIKLIS
ncbi:MAG: hypothetical protein RL610_1254 [Pseudomonadota bacterium]|jgi:hypothetical protein